MVDLPAIEAAIVAIYPGHGIQFVRNDAKGFNNLFDIVSVQIFKFCRSKCHKNFKMKRNPRKVKWTKAYRSLLGKDVTQESDLKLERKRNRPERYDRNLMRDILDSIRHNDRVESHKAERHSLKKLEANKHRREKEKQKELQQDISLISALALLLEPSLSPPKINVKISQAQLEENLPMEE
ncbi:hypothetical protein Cgig2_006376 [Carnegiea gigantea]|uniref:Large ribosomal subunit protein eL24-related N-terminal domain-containing protein n=1 Tax=Carnegiea gigantea TaxID=171969 RepID=A0A9Q1QCQ5_9CARY|nr:hypothetical protein Cgig2_006376 [Carnegiea gigantea]